MSEDLKRFRPEIKGQISYEHWHRYAFCRDLAAGKDVLDVGCGEGDGAALLAARARRVVGVDIDAATVAHAAEKYGGERLEFRVGDCASLPFGDAEFEVVVSFE